MVDLSLDELSGEVAQLLDEHGLLEAQPDGRVSAAPDARTIRYYTTLGLLDRPAFSSAGGRQARYGRRHLLQLLAIKALQGAALPLSEIQARLYGRSDEELEALWGSVAAARPERAFVPAYPIVWREVVIAPGLKLLAQDGCGGGRDGWPGGDLDALTDRIRAALTALQPASPRRTE
jgi:DNA-binding transcriptional MerR regulator